MLRDPGLNSPGAAVERGGGVSFTGIAVRRLRCSASGQRLFPRVAALSAAVSEHKQKRRRTMGGVQRSGGHNEADVWLSGVGGVGSSLSLSLRLMVSRSFLRSCKHVNAKM